jgi:hypothetical protein
MTVYFHGSFGLNREYMAGVLAASLKKPQSSGDEIAAPFGYKAPFTGRYKSWLHKTGITTKGRTTTLTPMGEVIWEMDPKLQSLITQWFMHHELCTDPERAEAWHYFMYEFLPKHRTFTTSNLEDGLAMKLMPHHSTHFGKGSSMIKVIARKIIQCYTQPDALGDLGIISDSGGGLYKMQNIDQLGRWPSPNSLKAAYQ